MCEPAPLNISISVHRAVIFLTFFVLAGPVDRCIRTVSFEQFFLYSFDSILKVCLCFCIICVHRAVAL